MPAPASPHRAPHFNPNPASAPGVIGLPPLNAQVKAGIRFLVVDDDRTLRESCSNLLQLDGYQVTAVGRGQEALELLRHRRFDIALLDLYMSEVSGYELLRAAIEACPEMIVIMMTGNPSVASTDASVFITGESGSGKELIAQFIHAHSRRSSKPLVALNCAALPEALLESEMFGHVKGAFTGAVRDKAGLLETANGGTLFLDELLEMSKPTQAKLLRVIQDGVVRRVGSETTDAVVNVRFIAATNGDPEEAVKSGTLREDLYYRLRVVPINVPRLQNRTEDIPLLANHFLNYYWHAHRGAEHGNAVPTLSDSAVRALRAHSWPGNVRELQNVIEHAVVLLEPGAELRAEDLPFSPGQAGVEEAASLSAAVTMPLEETYHVARERLLAEFERRYLTWLVGQADNNISRAARIAAVDRTTLYRLMERHGLQRRLTQTTEEP